jgi:hypothetical protein
LGVVACLFYFATLGSNAAGNEEGEDLGEVFEEEGRVKVPKKKSRDK